MKAIIKEGFEPGFALKDVAPPTPGENPIIRMEAAAICGTDIHMYQDMSEYSTSIVPVVMGHEGCGVVVDAGKSSLKVGQKVVVDSVISCGECLYCRTGKENLCTNRKTLGMQLDGVFAEYLQIPERACFPVPEEMPSVLGACAEPLGVALRGIERAQLCAGDRIAIVGPGPIGLFAMMLAKLSGAAQVDMVGTHIDKVRLALAKNLGVDHIFYAEDEEIKAWHQNYTHVFEWSGASPGFGTACDLVAPGGTIIAGAIYRKPVAVNMTRLVRSEVTVKTARSRTYETWKRSLDLLSSKTIDIAPLIETFDITEAEKAFAYAVDKQIIKGVFTF